MNPASQGNGFQQPRSGREVLVSVRVQQITCRNSLRASNGTVNVVLSLCLNGKTLFANAILLSAYYGLSITLSADSNCSCPSEPRHHHNCPSSRRNFLSRGRSKNNRVAATIVGCLHVNLGALRLTVCSGDPSECDIWLQKEGGDAIFFAHIPVPPCRYDFSSWPAALDTNSSSLGT